MRYFQKTQVTRLLATAAVATCFAQLPAGADELTDLAAKIEANLKSADWATSVITAHEVLDQVWNKVPMGFSAVVLTTAEASGFGVFNARENNVFAPDEPILIYAEPYGFGYGDVSAGIYQIAFDVDMVVKSETGTVLAEFPDIMELSLNTRRRNKEFHANITYNLTGASPGKYILVTTLRDKNSPKSASFETAIEVAQ
jgi:hypothetical protein